MKILYVKMSTVHSDKASDGPVCVILVWSSWLHIILPLLLKVSKSPRVGMPKVWSLYLLKLVPRIFIQAFCLSTSYILVRVSTYRNNIKRMLGELQSPLLQCGAGTLSLLRRNHCSQDISPNFYLPHVGRTRPFCVSTPFTSLKWLLVHILMCRTSILLDFRWF